MADTKISALTAATTPLAGTEVLPIVQSGVTKQVSVANLTAGRAVSGLSFTSTSDSTFNGVVVGKGNASGAATSVAVGFGALANYTGNYGTAVGYQAANSILSSNGIAAFGYRACAASTNATNAGFGRQALEAEASGAGNLAVGHYAGYLINGGSNNCIIGYSAVTSAGTQAQLTAVGTNALAANTGSNNTAIGYNAGSTATSGSNNGFFGNGAAPSAVGVSNEYTYGDSNVTAHRFYGNLTPLGAAKGINFTANTPAAGMTSQLLNWYEEGTWTPTLVLGAGSVTYTSQNGRYTRIGRVVVFSMSIVVATATTPSSTMEIGGLPFTPTSTSLGAVAIQVTGATALATTTWMGNVESAAKFVRVYTYAAGNLANPGAYVQAGFSIQISGTYEV
jgi:hypothetical protein